MNILVTGGAGYIGSITCQALKKAGYQVTVYDSLETGHAETVKDFKLIKGNIKNKNKLKQVLINNNIDGVIHFAAYIEMGESMKQPFKYFDNNFYGSLNLLQAMVETKVDKIIFSSTAGVYGNPAEIPIKETARKKPENPYGESKWMIEKTLRWFDKIHNLKSISIRYFNAAGASLDGQLGENHQPESHLIPNIIKALLSKEKFYLFGDDYKTKDGTCVRDYIHVLDLASAHIKALQALESGHKTDVYNAGTGQGYSNKEIIKMVEKVSGKKINLEIGKRRPGDANKLVADSRKMQKDLNWKPKYSDIKTIIETAYQWHKGLGF